ncbi:MULTISPECIES: S-methyl-5-thioribose-1-phosphate isomerase [unclassified Marichromatium]|uniref:S-methyl-5-thioribose-1-phosphate isomerase n=1 Tax=unclassified Marichromatium TaxID=2618417 RepID=UPI000F3AB094|nr:MULTISPECIES: S-methyl-5-thioribose-1-phosphate isomerase [unclassified Marichromatium]MBO8084827.1 S-methyl-5-thioribose-1-phosphate isomerase [Marichromatium sp.]RNE90959.1 S-methyl-5-thioribose-1-phosphate isomerase [Marichromatium sp. AB31]RNE93350.1 S-methyl-5-thioribose-1-phosphate isomerase [Marichromatium sp. AB32]
METATPFVPTPDDAVRWQDDRLYLLDQRVLPARIEVLAYDDAAAVAEAIRDMVVRGAPAIGVAAAYGVALAGRTAFAAAGTDWKQAIEGDLERLAGSRPTAVNLFWAIRRMRALIATLGAADPFAALLAEARAVHEEDRAANRRIGELGAALITAPTEIITHCNAGALATGGYGTALGVVRAAHAAGKVERVYADETRPWMQGARLTAWELMQDDIPVTLQADCAAASLMAQGRVGWVVVGADRITANGDVANKIGTYGLAVMARHHGIRFMVAAPTSTIDMGLATGAEIPIEERDPAELLGCGGNPVAPAGCAARNPVFDVTPAALVDAIVTERGVVLEPTPERMRALMG